MNRFGLADPNPTMEEIQKWQYSFLVCGRVPYPQAVLWICDILVRIRLGPNSHHWLTDPDSVPVSVSCSIRQWPSRCHLDPSKIIMDPDGPKKRRIRIHNTVRKYPTVLLTDPDPQSWVVDLDIGGQFLLITDQNTTSMLPSRHYWCHTGTYIIKL